MTHLPLQALSHCRYQRVVAAAHAAIAPPPMMPHRARQAPYACGPPKSSGEHARAQLPAALAPPATPPPQPRYFLYVFQHCCPQGIDCAGAFGVGICMLDGAEGAWVYGICDGDIPAALGLAACASCNPAGAPLIGPIVHSVVALSLRRYSLSRAKPNFTNELRTMLSS